MERIALVDIDPASASESETYRREIDRVFSSFRAAGACIITLPDDQKGVIEATMVGCREEESLQPGGGSGGDQAGSSGGSLSDATIAGSSRVVYIENSGNALAPSSRLGERMQGLTRVLDRVGRTLLSALARSTGLRLRGDSFSNLLDDAPLESTQAASSSLLAFSWPSQHPPNPPKSPKFSPGASTGDTVSRSDETLGGMQSRKAEGLLALASHPCTEGLELCQGDASKWQSTRALPGEVIVVVGKALAYQLASIIQAPRMRASSPAGLRCPCQGSIHISLLYHLRPMPEAQLDPCALLRPAGHDVSIMDFPPRPVMGLGGEVVTPVASPLGGARLSPFFVEKNLMTPENSSDAVILGSGNFSGNFSGHGSGNFLVPPSMDNEAVQRSKRSSMSTLKMESWDVMTKVTQEASASGEASGESMDVEQKDTVQGVVRMFSRNWGKGLPGQNDRAVDGGRVFTHRVRIEDAALPQGMFVDALSEEFLRKGVVERRHLREAVFLFDGRLMGDPREPVENLGKAHKNVGIVDGDVLDCFLQVRAGITLCAIVVNKQLSGAPPEASGAGAGAAKMSFQHDLDPIGEIRSGSSSEVPVG
mmetsp:Transcript_10966/g.34848  ORF Transcript_10966/g.34848 Transcript_10966/m.34848 type:complete len:593 (-) Transcript_10966:67-1845(-)|eukprot:CAMPEP_0182866612 /NCGR_PEP_ID=MMETSP0034_2-20130328/8290_1 /TAXON_ID=156128 /ORGANISM="Nephroselmis pyriformis, Strain CCMP717" /LENGTH=592 /DNA_ID=CAMNT_0024998941 /DNA_START=130 /DNA_END=1908 /DNA_ORIENTATION=-